MNNTEPYTKISDSIAISIEKIYRAGGLALVFVFIGLLLTVFSSIFKPSEYSLPIFIIGSILILTSFILFSITHYQGPIKSRRALKQSKETLDSLQEISLELVGFTSNVQSYCFKNLDNIQHTVDAALPLIKPFLGTKGKDITLKIENITSGIVDFSSKTEQVIRDIEKALKDNNFKILKEYESDITELNEQLKNALKKMGLSEFPNRFNA